MKRFYPFIFLVAPLLADDIVPATVQVEELRLVARRLVMDNIELQCRLEELENISKRLLERQAIQAAETNLIENRAKEAAAKAETTLPLLTEDEQKIQRQLTDAVRALQRAEEAQKELMAQNGKLLKLLEAIATATPNLDKTLQAQAIAEIEAGKRLAEVLRKEKLGAAFGAEKVETGTLQQATIYKLNENLRLVVINVGAAQGVRVGMPFVVRRENQLVGLVRAVDVRDTIAGAMVERIEKKGWPQVGDTASVYTE